MDELEWLVMRRPRKLILRAILFVVLGAIVNIAVAWGCAAFCGSRDFNVRIITDVERRWLLNNGETANTDSVYVYTGYGVRWDDFFLHSPMADESRRAFEEENPDVRVEWDAYECTWFSAGWPIRSMGAAFWVHTPDWGLKKLNAEDGGATVEVHGGWPISDETSLTPMIPYWPTWPGFAINTMFYAAVLWLLFAAPFTLRRFIRARRGLCFGCGYDLRGQPMETNGRTCPECGRFSPRTRG